MANLKYYWDLIKVKTNLSLRGKSTTPAVAKGSWSVVGFFQNDGGFLREWVLFYLSQGAEHVFLVDNDSTDSSREELQPFVESGYVSLYEPNRNLEFKDQVVDAYNRLGTLAKSKSEYAMFLDSDEFLVLPEGKSLSQELQSSPPEYGRVYNWCLFGTSSVETVPPNQWMLEHLTHRFDESHNEHLHVKSLVKVTEPFEFFMGNPHYPELPWGRKMEWPDGSPFVSGQRKIDFSRGKIHHYWYRSEAFYREVKLPRRKAFDGGRPEEIETQHRADSNAVEDVSARLYIAALEEWAKSHSL